MKNLFIATTLLTMTSNVFALTSSEVTLGKLLNGKKIECSLNKTKLEFIANSKGKIIVNSSEYDTEEVEVDLSSQWINLSLYTDATIESIFHIRYSLENKELELNSSSLNVVDDQAGGQSLILQAINCEVK